MQRIDTIIFDMDGTLVDSGPDILRSVNGALAEMGLPSVTFEQARKGIGPGSTAFTRAMLPEDQLHRSEELLRTYKRIYWDHCTEGTTVYPGIPALLDRLRGLNLAVATNKPRSMTVKILKYFGLLERFRVVIGPEDVVKLKPDPEMLFKVLEALDSTPERALMVGDTDNDMLAAKAAGMATCAVTYGYFSRGELEAHGPGCMIDAPLELLEVLDGCLQWSDGALFTTDRE